MQLCSWLVPEDGLLSSIMWKTVKAAIETVEAVRSLGAEAIAVAGDVSIEGDVVNILKRPKPNLVT